MSFGTEGRRPQDEVAASDYVYPYIVFRGSDVKDLRIEETPKKDTLPKQPVPDDPAILGVSVGFKCSIVVLKHPNYNPMMKYFGCKLYCMLKAQDPCG